MRQSLRLGISLRLLLSITLTFSLISVLTYLANSTLNRRLIETQARANAKALAEVAKLNIESKLSRLEAATKTAASFLSSQAKLKPSESDFNYLRSLIERFPEIYGSAIAWDPEFNKSKLHAPYVYRTNNTLIESNLNSASYNYPQKDWFRLTKQLSSSMWSPPYFDEGGGNVLMLTFSSPFFHARDPSLFAGVITADVSLDWLDQALNAEKLSIDSFIFLIDKNGNYITKPNSLNGDSFFNALEKFEYDTLVPEMLSKPLGFAELDLGEKDQVDYYLHYQSLKDYPWIIGVMTKKLDLLSGLTSLNQRNLIVSLAGAITLVLVVYFLSFQLTRRISQLSKLTSKIASGDFKIEIPYDSNNDEISDLNDAFGQMRAHIKDYIIRSLETAKTQQALESELDIAKQIQASSLPKQLSPYLNASTSLRLHAWMRAAQKVGGDLYNFHWRQERFLYLLLGDVSGKGISAAMFMVQIQVLAESLTAQGKDPATILTELNKKICQDESCMFVTMVLACVDIETGELVLSNAGHDFPILVEPNKQARPFHESSRSLACGLDDSVDYENSRHILGENCMLLFYTDGVSEAHNENGKLFGENKLVEILSSSKFSSPDELNLLIIREVDNFAQNVAQADDIALVCLKWTKNNSVQTLKHDFKLELKELESINKWLSEHLHQDELRNNLQLVFEELFVNACSYSGLKHPNSGEIVSATIQLLEEGVCWRLSYPGRKFNAIDHELKASSVKLADSLDDMTEGGLGLFLVKQLSEELRYEYSNGLNKVSGFMKTSI